MPTSLPSNVSRPDSTRCRSRVLLAHRFYDPDITNYAQMLRHIAERLDADGQDVTVYSTQPSYNSVYDGPRLPTRATERGVSVIRIRIPGAGSSTGRLLGGFAYCLRLVLHVASGKRRYDVISVSTVPPVAMGLAGVLAAKLGRAKLVYHCMDLYPEIAVASNLVAGGSMWERLARHLDSITVRAADRVVVLSEDMRRSLAQRGADPRRVVVRNNFSVAAESGPGPISDAAELGDAEFRVLFAGNLGRFQGLDDVVRGFAELLRRTPVSASLTLMGSGVAASELEALAEDLGIAGRVRLTGHRSEEAARSAVREADLCIVSLAPGIIGSAYPSKTITYLENGARILAVVEPDSELAGLVGQHDLGSTARPGDPTSIADALQRELVRMPAGEGAAERVATRLFGRDGVLEAWSRIFAELLADSP